MRPKPRGSPDGSTMIGRWVRFALWRPFELSCRKFPLIPLRARVSQPYEHVRLIQISNVVTRAITALGGGYEYSVCYVIDDELLVDTGFPWAARRFRQTMHELELDGRIHTIVNTHAHEDHTGNNDVVMESNEVTVLAHAQAIPHIRHPADLPWYRHFMFGPPRPVPVQELPSVIRTRHCELRIVHTPGHTPGHICVFEPNRGWLFSGDLFVSASLDSQLREVDGPAWIRSLDVAIELEPRVLFDGHGKVVEGASKIGELLRRKRDFLRELERRVLAAASEAKSIREITREVFGEKGFVNAASFGDGWLSLLTASDFSRSHVVESFLREDKA